MLSYLIDNIITFILPSGGAMKANEWELYGSEWLTHKVIYELEEDENCWPLSRTIEQLDNGSYGGYA